MSDSQVAWELYEKAIACARNGGLSAATELLGKAVREYKLCEDAYGESHALKMLAALHNDIGNFEQAARYHTTGLEVARRIGRESSLIVEHLDGLGTSCSNMGRWRQAVDYFEQALKEAQKPIAQIRRLRAHILLHLANVHLRYTEQYQDGIQLYDEAIAISKDFGDQSNIGYCLTFKAQALYAMGEVEKGLQLHEQARTIAEASRDEQLLGVCYAHLAAIYSELGKAELARRYCEQALAIDRKYSNKQGVSRDLILMGQLYTHDGVDEAALQAYQEGFLLARSIGDVQNSLILVERLASIYSRRHQVNEARKYYEEALTLCRESGDKRAEINAMLGQAALGGLQEVLETLEDALTMAQEHGVLDLEQQAETSLARLFDHLGDYEEARKKYKRSVALLEQMRSSLKVEEHLRAFSESYADVYERLVDLCAMLGYKAEAFEYAERSRARVLNNMMRARQIRPLMVLEGHQLARYKEVCNRIIALDLEIEATRLGEKSGPEELVQRLRQVLLDEAELILTAKRSMPETWAVDSFGVTGLEALQEQLRSLEQDILVLAYYTTAKDSYIFVIRKDAFAIRSLDMNNVALREMIHGFRQALGIRETMVRDVAIVPRAPRPDKPDIYIPSQRLFDALIRPIYSEFQTADHVCIIPHGSLHYVPFHALYDGANYLIEQKPISYASSATALSMSLAEEFVPVRKVLAFGDPKSELPPLPFARQEVETIRELLGDERCWRKVGAEATRTVLIEAGSGLLGNAAFDAWHLATHAVFIRSAPHLSYLQLAPGNGTDGRVFAFELSGLKRVGRLIVASACRTALTHESRGDEVNGLLYSFIAAGAQAVVASLWPVADESTASLMKAFYKYQMNTERSSLADALQKAQIDLLRSPRTDSPYYWAPFVLHGNWRPVARPVLDVMQQVQTEIRQDTSVVKSRMANEGESGQTEKRAQVYFHQGKSLLARARIEDERTSWALLPEEEKKPLEKAVEAFSQAIEVYRDYQAAYRERGIAYYSLRDWEKAAADLKQAVELNGDDALATGCLGLIFAEREEDRQAAIDLLKRAFKIDPKVQMQYPRVNTRHLQDVLDRLQAEQKVEECTRLIDSLPGEANLFVERGYAYQQLSYTTNLYKENQERAIEDYKRALEIDMHCALAMVRLAFIKYSNYKEGAIEAYERVVEMDSQCGEARLRLAQACKYRHNLDRAIAEYQAALALDPVIQHAYCGLGEAYLDQGDWKRAIQAFESEIRLNPNCFNAHLYLSEIYSAQNRHEEALRAYEECLRTTEHPLYEGKLGIGLSSEVTDWIKELATREKAGHLQPAVRPKGLQRSELEAYLHKGRELANAGRTREAIAIYTELIEKDPTNALVYAYRGGCYGNIDEYENAFADLRKAVELDPTCAVAYFNMHVLHQNRWEFRKAQEALDRAIMLDPEMAKKVRQNLSEEE